MEKGFEFRKDPSHRERLPSFVPNCHGRARIAWFLAVWLTIFAPVPVHLGGRESYQIKSSPEVLQTVSPDQIT